MPTIHYKCVDGFTHSVSADSGLSVMEVARNEGLPGMIAECGGAGACATCHVYVDDGFMDRVREADDFEVEMLEEAKSERRRTSRLACQIMVTDFLDGLKVEIAPEQ